MDRHLSLQNGYAAVSVQEPWRHDRNQGAHTSKTPEEPKSAWDKLTQTWTLEIGGFVAALLCLAATGALLWVYDNQLVPQWPVTLNSILSLLGNVAFASTLFGVHASVAQSQWIWFVKRPRPIAELATFQKARGSAIGAIQLLVVAVIASLAIVMGMLWSPFTQNLIRYESGNIIAAGETALLSRSVEYSGRGIAVEFQSKTRLVGCDLLAYHQDPFLELDIMSALITAPNKDINLPRFFCSTGNCTWAPIATLGFCSQCTDITSQIELVYKTDNITVDTTTRVRQTCTAILPGGTAGLHSIGTDASFESLMNVTEVGGHHEGLRYHSIRMLPPYTMNSAPRRPVSQANFSATECSLSPCVLSLQASVRNGIYNETLLDTFIDMEPLPSGTTWTRNKLQPPWGPERGIDPAANLLFGLNEMLERDWSRSGFLLGNKTIPGSAITWDGHTGVEFCIDKLPNGCTRGPIPEYIFNANYTPSACGSPNADTFACAMGGIAAALTKTVRNAGVIANGTDIGDEFLVRGQAETAATFVRVQWYWIALPCAVWMLGLIAWAVVAIQTRRMHLPTWRDDPLPLLFLYRGGDDDHRGSETEARTQLYDAFVAADDYSSWAYKKVAEGMDVQLREVPSQTRGGGRTMRLVQTEKG
ncbi:hypothetical protein C8A00DRAFT_18683 [Chaetomidium leptoderma]|uniref:Uncharacterized protein n=1 Tax=Chaetomidium leptoderma TaxID=669021 RepID=A0AAN6VDV7_9PEZI|nr:hypothetical protein C8A00DRAFT_18683 [Chaetomidium leptoderma]